MKPFSSLPIDTMMQSYFLDKSSWDNSQAPQGPKTLH